MKLTVTKKIPDLIKKQFNLIKKSIKEPVQRENNKNHEEAYFKSKQTRNWGCAAFWVGIDIKYNYAPDST